MGATPTPSLHTLGVSFPSFPYSPEGTPLPVSDPRFYCRSSESRSGSDSRDTRSRHAHPRRNTSKSNVSRRTVVTHLDHGDDWTGTSHIDPHVLRRVRKKWSKGESPR